MKYIRLSIIAVPMAISFLYAGCARPKRDAGAEKKPPEVAKEEHKAEETADKLWNNLQTADYQKKWKMWPGKQAFYPGNEPHGSLLTTYVNDTAYDAIVNKEDHLPYGSIIIKENYTSDRQLTSITIMQKIEGFNPDDHDWYWAKFSPGGIVMTRREQGQTIKLAGKIDECINCHSKQSDNDYLFTGPLIEGVPGTGETRQETETNEETTGYSDEETPEAEEPMAGEEERETLNDEEIADELWNTIKHEDYRQNWKIWPDKKAFYEGKKPHGPLVTTYVNDIAYDAIVNKKKQMPIGTVIVQENYTEDKDLTAINIMSKRAHYDEEANNWYWAQYNPDGEIMTTEEDGKSIALAGKIADCIECHGRKANNDYVYTGPIRAF